MKTFIPKDHQDLPDSYGIEIVTDRGMVTELKAASHRFIIKSDVNGLWRDILEIVTFEDELVVFPVDKIVRLKFDKDFSKILEINKKMKKNDFEKSE